MSRPRGEAFTTDDFDLWLKLAAGNKLNTKNSWNVALIDYFHDLSYLRDGTSINFQKASATLDGCVKIYSSRVDSVVSETGKLLSGLVDKDSMQIVEDDDVDDVDQQTINKRTSTRLHPGSTLVKFDTIKSSERSITASGFDPLFRKLVSDFDEGGAKSLFLNSLAVDNNVRLILDWNTRQRDLASEKVSKRNIKQRRLDKLGQFLFQDGFFDELKVSPTMERLQDAVTSVENKDNILAGIEKLSVPDIPEDDMDFNDNMSVVSEVFLNADEESSCELASTTIADTDLLHYFDTVLKNNCQLGGKRDHWKVANLKLKDAMVKAKTPSAAKPTNPEEKGIIDFFSIDDNEDIFTHSKSTLRKATKIDPNQYKLMEDIHYSAKNMVQLFLKKNSLVRKYKKNHSTKEPYQEPPDFCEEYLYGESHEDRVDFHAEKHREEKDNSQRLNDIVREELEELHQSYHDAVNFDNTIIEDDDMTENYIDPMDGNLTMQGYGSQLVTNQLASKIHPSYVNFDKISKKVDIRLLKANILHVIEEEDIIGFKGMLSKLSKCYTSQKFNDLSTSYCFISLLHLINEHKFFVENSVVSDDLIIINNR